MPYISASSLACLHNKGLFTEIFIAVFSWNHFQTAESMSSFVAIFICFLWELFSFEFTASSICFLFLMKFLIVDCLNLYCITVSVRFRPTSISLIISSFSWNDNYYFWTARAHMKSEFSYLNFRNEAKCFKKNPRSTKLLEYFAVRIGKLSFFSKKKTDKNLTFYLILRSEMRSSHTRGD